MMRSLMMSALTLSLLGSAVTIAGETKPSGKPAATRAGVDVKKVKEHLEKHQHYPATKAELASACGGLADLNAEEKAWLAGSLEDRTYASAAEVRAALKKK